jgi:hypothetical protein
MSSLLLDKAEIRNCRYCHNYTPVSGDHFYRNFQLSHHHQQFTPLAFPGFWKFAFTCWNSSLDSVALLFSLLQLQTEMAARMKTFSNDRTGFILLLLIGGSRSNLLFILCSVMGDADGF